MTTEGPSDVERAEDEHIDSMELTSRSYDWMADKKYASMFNEIETGLSGVMARGQFEWVDRRVFDQVFDRLTLLSIYKLMKNGELETLDFPIARGKEAHVFHGTSIRGSVAVKIFHTSNAVFKNLMQYIEGDPRFGGLRRRHRDLVDLWVRKEYRNLLRLRKQGLDVPDAHAVHKNVLIMEYIGTESGPSPRLKDLRPDQPEAIVDRLLEFIAIAWQDAGIVHADLSEYNILLHEGRAVVIDVGQGVAESHPMAKEFLVRDVTRVVQWANRNGVELDVAEAMFDVLNMDTNELRRD